MEKRVVVTGMGPVTPIGIGNDEYWQALREGKNGIVRVTLFDPAEFASQMAGEMTHFDPSKYIERNTLKRLDRFSTFAIAASKLAMEDSGMDLEKEDHNRMGIIIGVGHSGNAGIEEQFKVLHEKGPGRVSPFFTIKVLANMPAANVAIMFNLKGPATTIATACTTGTHAIGDATRIIQRGDADVMLAGGTEGPISPLPYAGFCAAKAMSTRNDHPEKASRPFDRERDGFVMGEGSGIVVLESFEHATKRGARIYGEIIGYGMTCDAFHLIAPSKDGEGFARSMQAALDDAKINPEQVDYINAHGTSTKLNDAYETMAVKTVFRDYAYKIPISSTKSMAGHLLGASGAIEMIASLLCMKNGIVHPTINYEYPDPECDLDYVPNKAREKKLNIVLSNSFGFGGFNATLIARKV